MAQLCQRHTHAHIQTYRKYCMKSKQSPHTHTSIPRVADTIALKCKQYMYCNSVRNVLAMAKHLLLLRHKAIAIAAVAATASTTACCRWHFPPHVNIFLHVFTFSHHFAATASYTQCYLIFFPVGPT